jgi:transcriptional regulator with GAF, ATPase, and Fis domain
MVTPQRLSNKTDFICHIRRFRGILSYSTGRNAIKKPVRRNEFFREATLRLFSYLEIHEGLRECLQYIRKFMPADEVYLERLEQECLAYRIVARATPEMGVALDILAPLSEEAIRGVIKYRKMCEANQLPSVIMVNNPSEEPITRTIQKYLNVKPHSVLSVTLVVEGEVNGTPALVAEGGNRYTEEGAELFAVLHEPFFVAFANTLKHRKVLQLMELLEDDNRYFREELDKQRGLDIIGADFGLREVMESVRSVASGESSVLITGETGNRKEGIANAIHNLSSRSNGPFIPEMKRDGTTVHQGVRNK